MSQLTYFLADLYSKKMIENILDYAISRRCTIYFLNKVTAVPQALTLVQLMGIRKFGGVNILLETGQSYQPGIQFEEDTGTYQEIDLTSLFVNRPTLKQLQEEFGK